MKIVFKSIENILDEDKSIKLREFCLNIFTAKCLIAVFKLSLGAVTI